MRKDNQNRGPRALLCHGNRPSVGFHNPLSNRHAQAGPLGFRRIERLKDPPSLLRRQPWSIVPDQNPHARLRTAARPRAINLDPHRVSAGGQRILKNVSEDLPHPKAVDLAPRVLPNLFRNRHVPPLPVGCRLLPGLLPNGSQRAGSSLQLQGGRIVANLLQQVMELFVNLHQQGMTVVLVTHDPGIARYAARTVVFRDGLIVSDEKNAPLERAEATA